MKLRRREALMGLATGLTVKPTRAAVGETNPPPERIFTEGVVTHFIQTADGMDHALDLIRDAGFASIRDEVYWGLVERERNRLIIPDLAKAFVDGAVERGIRPLLTLDYGNPLWDGGDKPRSDEGVAAFTRYAEAIATAFAGKVVDYEIWNEWHWQMGNTTPGSPEDYVRLFTATREALRRADPNARAIADQVLIGDADGSLIARMAATGIFRDLDGITVHPYFFNRGNDRTPEAWARWMQTTDELVRQNNADVSVPLYVTEVGWPSHLGRFGVSRPRQAAMAMRLSLLARTLPFVPGIWWYDFRDDGTDLEEGEQNFGLVAHDFSPKPALAAIAAVNHLLAGARFLRRIDAANPMVHALSFRTPGGDDICALWLTSEQDCRIVRFRANGGKIVVGPSLGSSDTPAVTLPAEDGSGSDEFIHISLSATPLFLYGSLDHVAMIEDVEPRLPVEQCKL